MSGSYLSCSACKIVVRNKSWQYVKNLMSRSDIAKDEDGKLEEVGMNPSTRKMSGEWSRTTSA